MSITTTREISTGCLDNNTEFGKERCDSRTLRYLLSDEYSLWDELVEASPQGTVLCRSWWLNAVSPDIRVLGYFNDRHLVAGIPLYFERRFGVRICRMPKLVHTWGVVMEPLVGKARTVASREMEILTAFANELANQMIFVQAFHPSLTNWLPFMWKGFKQTTHLSYVIEDLSDTEWLWAQVADKVRNNIRRAQKQGLKVIPCDIDLVTTMTERSFKQQHLPLPFARSYVARIFSASIANGSGACFAAIDATGQPHASMFIVWDHKRAYGITTGTNPQLRASGAESLLIWHVLKFSAERSRAFDFSGSVIEHLEKFFRNFGGRLISYNRILKMPWPMYPFYPNVRQLDRP